MLMNTKKMVKFNPDDILEKLSNLGIKRSHLGNPTSIYYVGYSNPVISKAFRTGLINPDVLDKIETLITYLSNPTLKRPTIINFVQLQTRNDILQKQIESLENRDADRVKELTDVIRQVSNDLMRYSEQFLRASNFLEFSIKN